MQKTSATLRSQENRALYQIAGCLAWGCDYGIMGYDRYTDTVLARTLYAARVRKG